MKILYPSYRYIISITVFTLFILLPLQSKAQVSSAEGPPPVSASQFTEVLWDQINNPSTIGVSSQNFSVLNTFDARAADDFQVPGTSRWDIDTVNVIGFYNGGTQGPAESVNVFFFDDNGGLPGNEIAECRYLNIPPQSVLDPNFIINLPAPCSLLSGTYWISVQVNMAFNPNGQWFWFSENDQILSQFAWENPGNGGGTGCISWTPGQDCLINPQPGPDLAFQLIGKPFSLPRPVPTLNQWALTAAALLLGLSGAYYLKRRKICAHT